MNLKLNQGTKKAFLDIDSSQGFTDISRLFQRFMKTSKPLTMKDFAELLGRDEGEALKLARAKGEINADGELVGLLGLSIVPTNHELIMSGRKFYTWCAADSLIFPSLLNVKAEINSLDPLNGEKISLKIDHEYLTNVSPDGAMISWVDDIDEDDIRCSMCNRVHFFTSAETANKWHENNQDANILSVVDYYTLGVAVNN